MCDFYVAHCEFAWILICYNAWSQGSSDEMVVVSKYKVREVKSGTPMYFDFPKYMVQEVKNGPRVWSGINFLRWKGTPMYFFIVIWWSVFSDCMFDAYHLLYYFYPFGHCLSNLKIYVWATISVYLISKSMYDWAIYSFSYLWSIYLVVLTIITFLYVEQLKK